MSTVEYKSKFNPQKTQSLSLRLSSPLDSTSPHLRAQTTSPSPLSSPISPSVFQSGHTHITQVTHLSDLSLKSALGVGTDMSLGFQLNFDFPMQILCAYFVVLPLRDEGAISLGLSSLPSLFVRSLALTSIAAPVATLIFSLPNVSKGKVCVLPCNLFS
ncbi:hypothetical protein DVH24_004296 [Malus domestica]|uniref:Uncharacterized protein n=1 Tax=Malus domestica TaxID=3750 RepID=A0A498KBA0_MALDO|nr:hypothetical protein DVH24_004296 [Malus domestica]